MDENNATIEETMASVEETTQEDIQNDDIPTTTESSTENGEDIADDDKNDDSSILETVESTEDAPEHQPDDVPDVAPEQTTEEETTEEETTENITDFNNVDCWSNGVFIDGNWILKDYESGQYFYISDRYVVYVDERYNDAIVNTGWNFGNIKAYYQDNVVYYNYYNSPFYITEDLLIHWINDTENIVYVGSSETEEEITEDTETEVSVEFPILEKSLNEYSVSEGLLLLIFILGLVAFIYHVVFDK